MLRFKNVVEFRLHLSPSSAGSQGAREFVAKHYAKIKAENKSTPFLVREADVKAKLIARFPMGVERKLMMEGLSVEQIQTQLQHLHE